MKNPIHKTILAAALSLATLILQPSTLHAQGTAFTYQGQLKDGAAAANGSYDLTFSLFGVSTGGSAVAGPVTKSATGVTNGLFTVMLDFGANFPGADRWLEIAVRTNGAGAFSTLTPRQPITAAPYAIMAGNVSGTVAASGLSGTYSNAVTFNNAANIFSGNGSGLTAVNAATLGGLSSSNFWKTTGNAGASPTSGAFLGTTDNQPLEIKVNGTRALRLEPTPDDADHSNIVNVVAGSSGNFVGAGVYGATIAGGGAVNYFGPYTNKVLQDFGTVSGGMNNTSSNLWASVGGGQFNIASGENATIAGGSVNTGSGYSATVGGGENNISSGTDTTIGGGEDNISSGADATVGGGGGNTASGIYATAGGGQFNLASGQYAMSIGGHSNVASGDFSFAAGNGAKASHQGSFVWADDNGGAFSSTANNQFSVRALGGVRLAANVQVGTSSSDYRRLELGGGNALGYFYGSFPKFSDGIHLSYNYFADAGGGDHVFATDGATSRLTVGYGFVGLYVGIVNGVPSIQRLLANSTGVTVNGTFNNSSDRNVKQDFAPISSSQILEKVTQLPLSEWSYKEDATTRHIGPVAQDFYSTFHIGTDDKHIAPMDEGGVALAAIQGLNQKLEQKETEITELKQRLERLEQIITSKKGDTK